MDFPNLLPDPELVSLTDDELLDRLRLNVGFMRFAGSGRYEIIEQQQLMMELKRRGVAEADVVAAMEHGFEEGTEIRNRIF